VGDVTIKTGLGFFGWGHRALGLSRMGKFFVSFQKTREKSSSLEPFIGFLAFLVSKLWPKNNKTNSLMP